ncbi:MmgE/PrpD family protein [Corticibacterium sp. UT-5YL-CI-8]|nr:MmgE/PrpD family protein [Tianweitania sp. UT-5YL-CI-8]
MFTEALASLVTDTPAEAINAEMLSCATAALVDTLGCGIAGADSDVATASLTYLATVEAKPYAVLWGRAERTSPAEAAFFNAVAGHALDFDDSLPILRGHPSVPLFAAGLSAAADRNSSGRDLLAAFVLGLEVAARVGVALGHTHYVRGWHITATVGAISSAAMVGRLYGLTTDQMRHAFGIAAADSAGLVRNFGSMTKAVQVGRSARAGYVAARLAALGVTADTSIFDGDGGFLAVYGEAALKNVPTRTDWAILDPGIYVKRWPCCYATHRALAGIFSLVAANDIKAGEVDEIAVGFLPDSDRALVHTHPRNGLEGKFSIEYCAAAAVIDGALGLGSFTDAAVQRLPLQAMMKKVMRVAMPGIGSFSGVHGYTDVAITTRRGRFETRVEATPGSPEAPMTPADRREKFLDCVTPVIGAERAESLLVALSSIVDAKTADVVALLAVPTARRNRMA